MAKAVLGADFTAFDRAAARPRQRSPVFLIHSETRLGADAADPGSPDDRYVPLRGFRPVLEEFGLVLPVSDPAHEVDRLWRNALSQGRDCVFLSFTPPHRTFLPLHCPVIPIFPWEFDSLPCESWDDDPRHDWRLVLGKAGRAITHSTFAVTTTRRAMGFRYRVISVLAPVWDRFSPLYADSGAGPRATAAELRVLGRVFDSAVLDLRPLRPLALREGAPERLPDGAGDRDREQSLTLSGVIYTAVFSPTDGRTNWFDMICGFCWCFREVPDATLVLKLSRGDCDDAVLAMLKDLAKLGGFCCRVVIIDGTLSDSAYGALAAASHYGVNCSHGEGQCLPLMEFMSAGKPAIAPCHTAMADYVDQDNSFIVESHLEPACWPHDPRQMFRTHRYRLDFASLLAAYSESYRVATSEPARYARMAAAAHASLRAVCTRDHLREAIRRFILPAAGSLAGAPPARKRPMTLVGDRKTLP